MKTIKVDLDGLVDGISRLETLKERVRNHTVNVPEIEGSGETAQAVHSVAIVFKNLENVWDNLIEESITFFGEMEKKYEGEQDELAVSIKGI